MPDHEPWVSVDIVATHLGIAKVTVYRWIESRGCSPTGSVASGSSSSPRWTSG